MSKAFLKKKYHYFFSVTILGIFIIFLISTSGCLGKERISEHDAVSIALNDSQTLRLIGNNEFKVVDVGLTSISSGDKMPEEVYGIFIEKRNHTQERINVFVNFEGKVVSVSTSYTAKAPDSLIKRINETPV
ncbi:MAG: hypothetical protein Q7T80_02670 [Methanoregula sp.]|nr:hypothetical protein [Methanoregula sp.]